MKFDRLRAAGAAMLMLAAASGPAFAQAKQDFTLVNSTGYALRALFVAPTKSNSWEDNILGRDILATDEEIEIEFDRGDKTCLWDLRVVYEDDGSNAVWSQIDLCKWSVITIHYDRNADKTYADFR